MIKKFKLTYSIPFLCLIICAIVFALSGCGAKLTSPSISLSADYILSWERINGASYYEICINDSTYATSNNEYNVSPYLDAGEYTIRVRAISSAIDVFTDSSDYSNPIRFSFSSEKMSEIEDSTFDVKMVNNSLIASWDYALSGVSFNVRYAKSGTTDYGYVTTTDHSCDLHTNIEDGGLIDVSVRVVGYNGKQPSNYTSAKTIMFTKLLNSPEFSGSGLGNYVSWNAVKNATSYNVNLLGSANSKNITTTSINISSLSGYNSSGFNVVYVQAVGSESNNTKTSNFSNGYAIFNFSSQQDAANTQKSVLGKSFDFNADSQTELDRIIQYALYYRMEKVVFYMSESVWSTKSSRKNAISDAFDHYPEIMCVTQGAQADTKKVTLEITYYDTSAPQTMAAGNYVVTQDQSIQPKYYATAENKRDANYNSFSILINNNGSMVVYTGEQLFQALSTGYKPVFVGSGTTAEILYNRMCSVLREVVSDNMSDFEKTLAIYEWICFNNKYDHNLSSLSADLEQYIAQYKSTNSQKALAYSKQLWDLRGFYLEGIFLDDGVAVCDGISKAFACLCGIEGIQCYKVNGTASQRSGFSTSNGGHAWNKVKLNNVVSTWYCVDCTWGDDWTKTTSGGITYVTEKLKYEYFLETDAMFKDSSKSQYHTESYPNTDVAEFKNYQFSYNANNYDLYADSAAELKAAAYQLLQDNDCISVSVRGTVKLMLSNYLAEVDPNIKFYELYAQSGVGNYSVYMIYK